MTHPLAIKGNRSGAIDLSGGGTGIGRNEEMISLGVLAGGCRANSNGTARKASMKSHRPDDARPEPPLITTDQPLEIFP